METVLFIDEANSFAHVDWRDRRYNTFIGYQTLNLPLQLLASRILIHTKVCDSCDQTPESRQTSPTAFILHIVFPKLLCSVEACSWDYSDHTRPPRPPILNKRSCFTYSWAHTSGMWWDFVGENECLMADPYPLEVQACSNMSDPRYCFIVYLVQVFFDTISVSWS